MLPVTVNQLQFEYDIHSLVKAFYPGEDVKVLEQQDTVLTADPQIAVSFMENAISVTVSGEGARRVRREAGPVNAAHRPEVKNCLKRALYEALCEFTGQLLPWGTLTGIRPTKIPMSMLEEGRSDAEILQHMKDTYYISDEKGNLSLDIAKREKEILSAIHYRDGYSLYIGIPFCPTTCLYCSFTSYPISVWKSRVEDYLEALEKEIDFVADTYRNKILDSVYIGGGTPTTLEAGQLERLLIKVRTSFEFSQVKEFTVEAGRADSITQNKLAVLMQYGVTRISVNPQTMKQDTLKLIGRGGSVAQVIDAFHMAREAGFKNINMDLILGLPGETEEDVAATLEAVKLLSPDSLTVHSLAIKRASKMHDWILENGALSLKNTDSTMKIAAQASADMGMNPYYLYRQKNMSGNFENVGYAREGCYGIYNILIMEEKQAIAALGPGSISKVVLGENRIERSDNVKDVGLYIERIDEMLERKRKLFALEKMFVSV